MNAGVKYCCVRKKEHKYLNKLVSWINLVSCFCFPVNFWRVWSELLATMTTLDDKILGEKLQYYYSSSDDEDSDRDDNQQKTIKDPVISVGAEVRERRAINTGTGEKLGIEVCSVHLLVVTLIYWL